MNPLVSLDNVSVEQLANTPADLMVIDFAKKQGKVPLTASDVARIKADGAIVGHVEASDTVIAALSGPIGGDIRRHSK